MNRNFNKMIIVGIREKKLGIKECCGANTGTGKQRNIKFCADIAGPFTICFKSIDPAVVKTTLNTKTGFSFGLCLKEAQKGKACNDQQTQFFHIAVIKQLLIFCRRLS